MFVSILLILSCYFRRPFDLGDRISISNPNERSGDADPGYDDMWLVEDCNLFTTTLRLARTNEISYVNNGMLSNCKIVNHGRSVNSLVNILVAIRLDATHEQIQLVKSSLVSTHSLEHLHNTEQNTNHCHTFRNNIFATIPECGRLWYSGALQKLILIWTSSLILFGCSMSSHGKSIQA